jgi:demethylmenaquinone methyltransferase/2-methoxy-6-polyprenyl-1,4-benzoquinol methylase
MTVELTTEPPPQPRTVDKSDGRVRRMFGEIAGRYDFLNHVLSGGVDYWWRRKTVRAVPPGDAPVLDVCTGTGDLAIAYWKAARGRVAVVGSDFTREMLVLAGEKSQRLKTQRNTDRPAFVEADTQRLPFADDSFGVVSVAFGLRNVRPNRQSAYNYLPDSVAEFPHGQALADLMTEAGLADVTFQPLTFGIATLYHGRKPARATERGDV